MNALKTKKIREELPVGISGEIPRAILEEMFGTFSEK